MDILREKIARAIEAEMTAQGDKFCNYISQVSDDGLVLIDGDFSLTAIADAILAIPELKEALEKAGHWSDGVELPAKVIGKLCDFYAGEKVIRVRDD